MAGDAKLDPTFEQRWAELGFADTARLPELGATLSPKPRADAAATTARLPRISLGFASEGEAPVALTGSDAGADLEVHGVLGEGGMGRVHAARQRSLSREVAVKVLRSAEASAAAVAALLREAVVTGALEHPGIVPVHALGLDDRGLPVLVMKRVEGVEWRVLIHDAAHPGWASRPGDRLTQHLDILMQVCQALHFAHSRGIVHRDVKPENVMLGDFGEVYLVDWGIAVRSDDRAALTGASALIGTPAYMAPEMVAGRPVTARTDVYLLGATLHEILTRQYRHSGETLQELLAGAFSSERVAYGADVPAELAEIANRAMAREPSERFASALELRAAIASFLRHKASIALADQAAERLELLGSLLVHAPGDDPPADIDRAYRLATEARFGFVQALREWPDNPRARRAQALCVEAAAELELRQGHMAAADSLMREIDAPSERLTELHKRVRRRQQRQELEQERLLALAHDLDVRVAGKQRARGLAAVTGAAIAVSLVALSQPNPSRIRPEALLAFAIVVLLAMLGVVLALRRALLENVFNRRLVGLALVAGVAVLASRAIATWIGMRAPAILAQDLLLLAAVAGASAVLLPWVALLVPLLTAASIACLAWPEQSVFVFSAAVIVAPPLVAHALWRHHRREQRARLDALPDSVDAASARLKRPGAGARARPTDRRA